MAKIESAANDGAFGINGKPMPSQGQLEAGNYPKGHVRLYGLDVAIEQPRNSVRTGAGEDGKPWSSRMAAHYGYIKGTRGADGDEVDVFVGQFPYSDHVFVINQYLGNRFDEHKVMLCFPDEETAINAYLDSYERGWPGLGGLVALSVSQFKQWLSGGNLTKPLKKITSKGMTMNNITWDSAAMPVGMNLDRVLYDLRVKDGRDGLIFDSVTMDDVLEDAESVIAMDAMVTPYAAIERKMAALKRVMDRASPDVNVESVTISDPFTSQGTANVASIFQLSDGQTVTIYLHNPDTTPKKIAPGDELISWKWMLNKMDITIAVAPEGGSDLNVREVARRIMRLAVKNMPRFAANKAKNDEYQAKIVVVESEIEGLEAELDSVQKELEAAVLNVKESNGPQQDDPVAKQVGSVAVNAPEPVGSEPETPSHDVSGQEGISDQEPDGNQQPSLNTDEAIKIAFGDVLVANDGDVQKASAEYFKSHLSGRVIGTVIGDVHILGSTFREMKRGINRNDLKARLIPHVPLVLSSGEYKGRAAINKQRKDDFVGFHYFYRTIDTGDLLVTASVSVGETASGEYQFKAYGLAHDGMPGFDKEKAATLDDTAFSHDEGLRSLGVPSRPTTKPNPSSSPLSAESIMMDSASMLVNDQGEINIEIIKVVDKKTGKEIPPAMGSKLNGNQGDVKAIASAVRKEIKAKLAGYKFSVVKASSNSIRVNLTSIPDDVNLYSAEFVEYLKSGDTSPFFGAQRMNANGKVSSNNRYSDSVGNALDMAEAIANQYNWDRSDSMTDYFDVNFYLSVNVDNDLVRERKEVELEDGEDSAGLDDQDSGVESNVKTAKGTKVSTKFRLVEAADLIASHDIDGNLNPDYPAELQPRDRGRDTSIAWVKKVAKNLDPDSLGKTSRADSGAPIVGPDLVVESGNGRTMAIQEAYRTGNAGEYREWLENEAEFFGISLSRVKSMKRPVLVRVRSGAGGMDRRQFAIEANQDDKLSMTGTERAKADGDRLDAALLSRLADDGDLTAASNRDFITAFLQSLGDTEAAQYMTSNGQPTGALIARIQAAIFAKAYQDDRLLEMTADASKPEVANILSALNVAAPEFILAREADADSVDTLSSQVVDGVSLSLDQEAVDAIIEATNLVRKAKVEGRSIDEVVNQQGLFGDIPPATKAMALFINKNNRSPKRLGTAFKAMADFVRKEAIRGQTVDIFGDNQRAGLQQILDAANRKLDQEYGEGEYAIDSLDFFSGQPKLEPESEPPQSVAHGQIEGDVNQDLSELPDYVIDDPMFGKVPEKDSSEHQRLRAEVRVFLESNLRDMEVKNAATGWNIELRMRGIKEMIRHSMNPVKLAMLPDIRRIVMTAKNPVSKDNNKKDKKPHVLRYHYLASRVSLEGKVYQVKLVIEEDRNGKMHYDLLVDPHKTKAALDSAAFGGREWNRDNESRDALQENNGTELDENQALDSASESDLRLNLFFVNELDDLELVEPGRKKRTKEDDLSIPDDIPDIETENPKLYRDISNSINTINGIDDGSIIGYERSLFVSSIANKIKTQAKNGLSSTVDAALYFIAKKNMESSKPAITSRNSIWRLNGKEMSDYVLSLKAKQPAPAPAPGPAPEAPGPDSPDVTFMKSVINGTAPDMLDPGLALKLEDIYNRHQSDPEMMGFFEQAVNAYSAAMMSATSEMK